MISRSDERNVARSMIVRGITKSDYDFIVSVLDRWWGGPSGIPAHPIFFFELGDHALVAEVDGAIVGFLFGFTVERPMPTGYVHMVGIHPDHRRESIGKRLYAAFTERCRLLGAKRMKTIAVSGDEVAIAFHRALGFDVEEDPDYAGPGRSRLVFTRDL